MLRDNEELAVSLDFATLRLDSSITTPESHVWDVDNVILRVR